MSESENRRIQVRRGTNSFLNGVVLNTAEFGFEIDAGRLYIGARAADGAIEDNNIEVFTSRTPNTTPLTEIVYESDNYTIKQSDHGAMIEMDLNVANNVTIPLNSSTTIDVGTTITVTQLGTGQTTITPEVGVTIRSLAGNTSISGQYGVVTLIKQNENTWSLFGDLS